MCEELRLERYDKSPWGFRLTGGLDFGAPLTVVKVRAIKNVIFVLFSVDNQRAFYFITILMGSKFHSTS